jgi:branched-chain amino acid transport system permease protein
LVGSILAPVVIYGTLFGLTYVILALGFTLLLGISRVLNIAYGALYMVTAYMIFYFGVDLGFNLILATVLAVGIAVAVGVVVFLLCARFAPDPMRFLVVTLLIALLLQYLFSYYFQGETGLIIPGLVPTHEILLFGVSVSPVYLVAAGVAIALLLTMWGWIEWTGYGRTVRAAAEDPETASQFGIRVRSVYLVVVAVSSFMVAIAAVLIVPAQEVTPTMWIEPFVIAFVVSVIGGLEKFMWTLPAAFLLSFSQEIVYFEYPTSASLSDIVAFAVAIGFIIVLPRGIGGIRRGR